ncbi:EAL domain-containing protein [Thioalkalivibrio sp. ALJ7]|uniref:bifunctional diguanylate cyclase/phosphodiesterase n=1 Tax=Thioalkalivibrio sp. ALJ7 TaxID=1158756 RepID=UPI00036BE281|nr:EAL domain-containing protein [Thioalkalivibrio sp. ALJ7]
MDFASSSTIGDLAYSGSHSAPLVVLSLTIAILAAFASISHVDLIRTTRSRLARIGWQVNGAVALGVGVWTMHFTGMVAFELPITIDYHMGITLLSVLPAIAAGYVALQVIREPRPTAREILTGGTLVGLGIGAMHYTGMTGMVVEADMVYRPGLFLLSIVAAVAMASLALAVPRLMGAFMEQRGLYQPTLFKLASAVLMGLAISSLHYVAMGATEFVPGDGHTANLPGAVIEPGLIAGLAVAAALFILITSTVTVTLRHGIEASLLEAELAATRARQLDDRFQKIASRLPGVVYQFRMTPDGHQSFPYASEAIEDVYGVQANEVREDASGLAEIIHPSDLQAVQDSIRTSASDLSVWRHEYRVIHRKRGERWLQGNATPEREPDGSILWNGFITDITEQRDSQKRIHQLAFFDDLTGLPNRRLLEDRMNRALAHSARHGTLGAVLFLDLDDFKRLNDTLGHSAGDTLLKALAQKLGRRIRGADTIARLGGDEFVIVLEEIATVEDLAAQRAGHIAEEIQALVTEPVRLSNHDHRCAASIGITLFFGEQETREELLRRADAAMYQAKAAGPNSIRFFNPELQAGMEARFQLEADLRASVGHDHFLLQYQRQVNQAGELAGAEALLRWRHPTRGLVGPAQFIPVAEETGLILPLGRWVLEEGCRQILQWQHDERTAGLTLSVNVSARQFYQEDFVEHVKTILRDNPIPPGRLKMELTESLVLTDIDDSTYKMEQLRSMGIQFSMDDFGTGYSSMAYLSRLPFAEVKIDKTFVQAAAHPDHQRDQIIIESIVALGRNLDMRVVAEGVETSEQLALLKGLGCEYFQGYYFGRPETADQIVT